MSTPWVLALPLLPYTIPSNILSSSIFLHIPRIRNTIPFDPEESVCRVRAKAFSFAEKRKRSRLQQPPPPPFPTIPAWWLSGIPKGMTRVRVVIRRLVEEGGTTRFYRFSGNRAHESCSFVHRGGVVINRREREREREYSLFIVDAYPVQKEEMCSIF